MKKIKCEVCRTWTGGFHLCVGPDAPPELKKGATVYRSHAERANERWARHYADNKDRDRQIHDMYMGGASVRQVAEALDVGPYTIRTVVKRLGGTMRPPGGIPRNTHQPIESE